MDHIFFMTSRHNLDLVRAVEREKIRKELIKSVEKTTQKFTNIIYSMITKWPKRRAAFYRN